jgi:hypothetical protein
MTFRPQKENVGRWLTLPSSEQTGSKVQVLFEPNGTMRTRYVLDPRIVQADLERNLRSREVYKKGSLLGNTQKHIVPIAHIPYEKYAQLKKRFGKDSKALLKFWNNSDHGAWKASEYKF